jgi:hypothetical protein
VVDNFNNRGLESKGCSMGQYSLVTNTGKVDELDSDSIMDIEDFVLMIM